MAEGTWKDVVLLTIRETPSKKEGKEGEGYGLWAVARVKPDGTLFNVTLRSGRYYKNKVTGSKEMPKDGLGYYDFMELKKPGKTPGVATMWEEVIKLLDPKHPPVLPSTDAPPPAAPEPEIEKMPWEK